MPEDQKQRPQSRKELAKKNRQALIDATLIAVAELGVAQTSVSEIINRAGLSRGMVHLHFGSKENLLVEAVKQAGQQYFDALGEFLQKTDETPEATIRAVVNGDLDETILNASSVKIWYAFRGAARQQETIGRYSDTRDVRLNNLICRAFCEICDTDGLADSTVLARDATHGTLALLEGMWSDFLLHPDEFDREAAVRVVFRFLSGLFPGRFAP